MAERYRADRYSASGILVQDFEFLARGKWRCAIRSSSDGYRRKVLGGAL